MTGCFQPWTVRPPRLPEGTCARAQTSAGAVAQTENMSDTWLGRVVMAAIALLILHAVATWTYAGFGVAAAVLSAVLVGAVSILSARMAGLRSRAWFVVPALLFTALPLAARLWTLMAIEQSWWARTVEFAPFLIGFAAPVLLLLVAYLDLSRRALSGAGRVLQ